MDMKHFAFQESVNDQYKDFQLWHWEKVSDLRSWLNFTCKTKKLTRNCIYEDLVVSFLFSCVYEPVFLHYHEFYLAYLYLLVAAVEEASHISYIYFSLLISDHSIFIIKSGDFFIKLKSQMHR